MFGFPIDLFGMHDGNNRRPINNSLIPSHPFFENSLMVPSPFGGINSFFDNFAIHSSPFAMMDRMMRATNDSLYQVGNTNTNGAVHSYSSTTVMSYDGTDGRPKVYQESISSRRGPGGLEETRQAIRDSERGINKVHIGHRIGDRKHVVEREMNVQTGQISENVELENLDEEETDDFKREWRQRSSVAGVSRRQHHPYHHRQLTSNRVHPSSSQTVQPQLAIEYNAPIGQSSNRHPQKSSKHTYHSSQRPQYHRSEMIDLTDDTPKIEEVQEIEQLPPPQVLSTKRKASSSSNDADTQRKHRQNHF